uniref:FHA domain-containing protein n=1 Tax=Strigamia maritima TaxID=126957 RepID=T1IWV6_STRMM
PTWSGTTDKAYKLEVIKNGVIVNTIDLNTKPFYVVGRLNTCDIVLEHPSVSRHHAVIQFRPVGDEQHSLGFYLYDLESTHGTSLNKQTLTARVYYQLHVGFNLKFGGSTRMFILQGPDEDQEPESKLTVTELKELRRKQEEKLARLENEEENAGEENKEQKESGIDWGMGEDAVEDEEEDLAENPFALNVVAPNEELYIDDPKKTLRGWFEREGYDLEYQVEERGYSQFCCKIRLPLENADSEPMVAEVVIKARKKEAVAACALEACRILDRQGLLRQANHESRKRKLKNWEDNDYYDSDEDTFLDRTGTIEKKRQQRIQKAGKDKFVVETYDSLKMKLDQISQEIEGLESSIQISQDLDKMGDKSGDSLDAYMSSISSDNYLDKTSRAASKLRLLQLRKEKLRLLQLVDIAKPTNLPELKPESKIYEIVASKKPLAMIGSMKGRGIKTRLAAPIIRKINPPVEKIETKEPIEEVKQSDEAKTEIEIPSPEIKVQSPEIELRAPEVDCSRKLSKIDGDQEIIVENSKPNRHKSRRKKFKSELNYVYDASNPDYALWMPPDNQTGDGRTRLNDKYGY